MSISKNWNSLIRPSRLSYEVIYDKDDINIAKIVAEPLERGFGLTIGNALRRVLLSSLQGAAITSIKIPGVLHEFSAVPGVKEDLSEIILNLKALAIRMHNTDKKNLKLKVTGPCVVTAGMIEGSHDVEILNHSHTICTLAKGIELEMEFTCEVGKGYAPVAIDQAMDLPIGVIQIDALFNPVRKVAYHIENTRVGQITDYDKLILEIETDGSITAEMAIALAAKILQHQLQLLITFKEEVEEKQDKLDKLPFDPILLKKVHELDLSVRSQNCLNNDNIVYIGDLVMKEEGKMLQTPNFGRKSLNELKKLLALRGLKFGMNIEGWPPENLEALAKKYDED